MRAKVYKAAPDGSAYPADAVFYAQATQENAGQCQRVIVLKAEQTGGFEVTDMLVRRMHWEPDQQWRPI